MGVSIDNLAPWRSAEQQAADQELVACCRVLRDARSAKDDGWMLGAQIDLDKALVAVDLLEAT
jgi:hypothetical protein